MYSRQQFGHHSAVLMVLLLAGALLAALVAFKVTNFDLIHESLEAPSLILFEAVLYAVAPLMLLIALHPKRPASRVLIAMAIACYYAAEFFLIVYYFSSKLFFDYYFFWFHRSEALETLSAVYSFLPLRVAGVVLTLVIISWSLHRTHSIVRHRVAVLPRALAAVLIMLWVVALAQLPGTPLKKLILDAIATHRIIGFSSYSRLYGESLKAQAQTQAVSKEQSVIMLELESINSDLVGPETTPVLHDLAKQGVLLTKHYSNAIQSKRAYEVILCSSLPSIAISARQDFNLSGAASVSLCLPEAMRRAGYRTLFFVNYDKEFQGVAAFMRSIGFDEVHGSEIMQPGDPTSEWGDREDVFYTRVADYLSAYPSEQKLFVYIIVGATNHHPFTASAEQIRSDVAASLPYRGETDYAKRRVNTLFAQDAYLRNFWEAMRRLSQFATADRYVYGDHPVAINQESPEYSFNTGASRQDNFQTVFLYIPGASVGKSIRTNRIVLDDLGTSHQNIAPTVLESVGLANPFPLSRSFLGLLADPQPGAQCSVNVQPYLHPAVALMQYPHKVVLDLQNGTVGYLDLSVHAAGAPEIYSMLDSSLDQAQSYLTACVHDDLDSALPE